MSGGAAALVIRDLTVGYPRRPVLNGLSLAPIGPGSVTAIIGPNAAGKSTLLRGIAGLLPAKGSIHLGGTELNGRDRRLRANRIGFMPQLLPSGARLCALETVIAALAAAPIDRQLISQPELRRRAMASLERLGIGDLALEALDTLSGGQRQLVSLAQAIARGPTVLLLDEPTSALDMRHQVRVMQVVRDLAADGAIVVAVLHDLALAARWADRIVVLSRGTLAAEGPPKEVLTPALLAGVYGVAARVERCSAGHLQVAVDGLAPAANQLMET